MSRAATRQVVVELRRRHDEPARSAVLIEGTLLIGREEGELRIEDLLVSRRHATLRISPEGEVILQDLDSTNGTFLNGRLLLGPSAVADGDDVRIGPAHLQIRIESA
jgi:pSer/pThr/pTyr-binding forkhead associated (FHA) protein